MQYSRGNPLISLWSAVLKQAIIDARSGGSATSNSGTRRLDQERAAEFLTCPSKDLKFLCDVLDLDMSHVVSVMKLDLRNKQIAVKPNMKKVG